MAHVRPWELAERTSKVKTYTCMRHVAEQTTELVDTERWFMAVCPRKRMLDSSTNCPIQSKMLQRQMDLRLA
ncbi:hypothetical protein J6590_007472 [Homalodisca vitripennis]|nr:hypothetical protein J6590_007472 [Homalodisca vitripennis]